MKSQISEFLNVFNNVFSHPFGKISFVATALVLLGNLGASNWAEAQDLREEMNRFERGFSSASELHQQATSYTHKEKKLSESFIDRIISVTRAHLFTQAKKAVLDSDSCAPYANVTFHPDFALTAPAAPDKTEKEFLEGLIFIDTFDCLPKARPETAKAILLTERFKKAASESNISFQMTGDVICEENGRRTFLGITVVGPTSYCVRNTYLSVPLSASHQHPLEAIFAELISNSPLPKFQHLYFRESLLTLVESETALRVHLGYAVRAQDVSMRESVKGSIVNAHKKWVKVLGASLAASKNDEHSN